VERNVAYTAPPGQIRTVGRLVGSEHDEVEAGMGSPTIRAMRMRERRAREWGRWRGVRMETLRNSAVERRRDVPDDEEEVDIMRGMGTGGAITPEFARQRFDGMEEGEERAERRLVHDWAQFSHERRIREVDWRDEFDEDRVGEENFGDGDLDLAGGRRRIRERITSAEMEGEGEGGRWDGAVMERTPEG
jgi:hypothetical protein